MMYDMHMACLWTARDIIEDPLMSAHGGAFSLSIQCTLDAPRAQSASPVDIWRWVKCWRAVWWGAGIDPGCRGGAWRTCRWLPRRVTKLARRKWENKSKLGWDERGREGESRRGKESAEVQRHVQLKNREEPGEAQMTERRSQKPDCWRLPACIFTSL